MVRQIVQQHKSSSVAPKSMGTDSFLNSHIQRLNATNRGASPKRDKAYDVKIGVNGSNYNGESFLMKSYKEAERCRPRQNVGISRVEHKSRAVADSYMMGHVKAIPKVPTENTRREMRGGATVVKERKEARPSSARPSSAVGSADAGRRPLASPLPAQFHGRLPGVTSVVAAELTPRSGQLAATPWFNDRAVSDMWRRVTELEEKGRHKDAAVLTAALLERYSKEINSPMVDAIARKSPGGTEGSPAAALQTPLRANGEESDAAASETLRPPTVSTPDEAPSATPAHSPSAMPAHSPSAMPGSPVLESLPDGVWRGHCLAKGHDTKARVPISFALYFTVTSTTPTIAGTVSGVEHNDEQPNTVSGSFSQGRLIMQKSNPVTNSSVTFSSTFHMGKIAGTWQEDDLSAEGTFLIAYEADAQSSSSPLTYDIKS